MAVPQTNIRTSLANVALGATPRLPGQTFENVDQLIESRTGPALNILRQGAAEQLRLSRLGTQAGVDPLRDQIDLRALEEQQALLGSQGLEAQEQAIGNIPVSELDRELQRRQQQSLLGRAAASGEVGGGATLLASQQLAGAQQADIIQNRLRQLQPLVALSRGLSGTVSQLQEQGRAGEAQLQSGLGTQLANIRLGSTAPQIQSRLNEAELSGLRGISRAQQRGQIAGQLAGLAGTLAGSFGNG